ISFIMRSGDKIALIGPNGAGKSTLIKIITGQIEADNGIVKRPKSVKYAYLEQNVSFPDETLTVLELICSQLDFTIQSARNLLGKFLFSDEDVFKKVSNLSGGEKSRLRLLIEMQQGVNLLILDEPTNHLDISAREEIEEALSMFGGSMIFISHDRHFVNKFAQRIFEIEDGSFNVYEGNYDYYLSKKQALIQQDKIAKPSVKKPFEGKKEKRKSDMIKRTLEQDIKHTEFELDVLTTEIEKYATDYEKLLHLVEKKDLLSEHLELLYEQWLGIEEE
ncbi:MAG: ATP-binding cassette domain-containing protein, partial [Clostridia bacterium]